MEISPLIMGRVQEKHMSYDREIDSSREVAVGPARPGQAAGLQINEKGARNIQGVAKQKVIGKRRAAAAGIIYYWPTCSHTHSTTKLWLRVLACIKN